MASVRILGMIPMVLVLICLPAWGAHKTVIRIEKSNAGLKQQNGLIITANQITITRNSNEWCGPQNEAHLGQMTRPPVENDRIDEAYLDQLQLRSQRKQKNIGSLPKSSDPEILQVTPEVGGSKYYLGSERLLVSSSGVSIIRNAILRNCSSDLKWTFIKGANAKLVRAQGRTFLQTTLLPSRKVTTQPIENTDCTLAGTTNTQPKKNVYRCTIEYFGAALLTSPSN